MKTIGLPARPQKLMWDAHSVVGAICGLALFVIFFAGAFSLFHKELRLWERRAYVGPGESNPSDRAALLEKLERSFDLEGHDLQLRLPTAPSVPYRAFWSAGDDHPDADADGFVSLEAGAGLSDWTPMRGDESLADLLFDLHFFNQLGPVGVYTAGFMAIFMLLGITTGVLIHLRKLVRDFHQFRPGVRLRRAWADAHTLFGTIGLPFQLVYAFTGVYYGLLGLILAPYAFLVTDGDLSKLSQLAGFPTVEHVHSEEPAPSVSLEKAIARFEARWPGVSPSRLAFEGYGRVGAVVSISGTMPHPFDPSPTLVLDGTTGETLAAVGPEDSGPLAATLQSFSTLHFATYAGDGLRLILFLLSFATCVVILTGNYLWIEVRADGGGRTRRLLASLTTGTWNGMVFATALSFLVRAVDLDIPVEFLFFGTCGLTILVALGRRVRATRLRPLLWTSALMFLALPLLDGWLTGAWMWNTWAEASSLFLVDVVFILTGIGTALLAVLPAGDVESAAQSRTAPFRSPRNEEESVSMPVGAST